jgi:uncharacterized 2Fe-2S/4Fe-4S cluster protein (DUF4445 family)
LFNKTPLVAGGKRIEADPGSSLMTACTKLGLRVPTKCKKGECGTCTVTVAGFHYYYYHHHHHHHHLIYYHHYHYHYHHHYYYHYHYHYHHYYHHHYYYH